MVMDVGGSGGALKVPANVQSNSEDRPSAHDLKEKVVHKADPNAQISISRQAAQDQWVSPVSDIQPTPEKVPASRKPQLSDEINHALAASNLKSSRPVEASVETQAPKIVLTESQIQKAKEVETPTRDGTPPQDPVAF